MRFYNATNSQEISTAVTDAHRLLDVQSKMIQEIVQKHDWKYESGTGADVVTKLLMNCKEPVKIFFYTPWNPWTRAVGYYDGMSIFINRRKFERFSHEDLVGLLLHEYSHHCGFTHGNNYKTSEKVKYSVPYYISENTGKWL